MGFEQDWPRMNAVPEWFTVEPDESHMYRVEDIGAGWTKVVSGKLLSEGLPVRIEPSKPLRLTVSLGDRKAGDILLMTTPSYAQQVEDPEPERFAKSMAAFAQQDSESPFDKGGIVFVGSSSVRRLDIPKYFPGLKALNRGFGGAHISDVNYYIEETVLKYEPSKVIFFCGGNDLWAGKSVPQVREDFDDFRKRLFERVPNAQLIVLGVRPSPRRIALIDTELKMNAALNNIARDDKRITYLNGSCDRFLDENGQPITGLYADDRLHMNDAGYRIWMEILGPFLP
jgi:lysophospholipase L1-like esterase